MTRARNCGTNIESRAFRACRALGQLALLAFAASGAPSCVQKPTMTLNHAEIAGVAVSLPPNVGLLMQIHVDVYNPNSYDIAVRAVQGQVVLAGRHNVPVDFRADGEGVWLNADSTTQVVVPVQVPLATSIAVLAESTLSAMIRYQFTGRADVTATRSLKLEKDDYSVSEEGTISRDQIQAGLHMGR
jgi:hypothetical protein